MQLNQPQRDTSMDKETSDERLHELEQLSVIAIREARVQFKNPALLWSCGKDSQTLLWLCRSSFFGINPFPVVFIDTGWHKIELLRFRDQQVEELGLNLIVAKNEKALSEGQGPSKSDKFTCCHKLKTVALMDCVEENGFDALFLGIRRDEHGIRAKERMWSPRNKDFKWNYMDQSPELWDHYDSEMNPGEHYRIHPLLAWREIDVWSYVKKNNLPVCPLYFASEGKRYRSLGCDPCSSPIDSDADTLDAIMKELCTTTDAERDGRAQDKEDTYNMQRLHALGYM